MRPTRRAALAALAAAAALKGAGLRAAQAPEPADWPAVLAAARGQTARWHAWAGDPRINAYIAWAGAECARRFGVAVEHVKLADTAEAVSRVVAEKAAGRDAGGAVDLIWINGPNFAAMKATGLLFGPFATALPHWRLVDPVANPAVATDFTIPTGGYASPWGMARVVFYFDAARLPAPPRTMAALLDWARANPGRFTYPQPPDFMGVTFLKQALYGLTPDPAPLLAPPGAAYDAVTAPLWDWLGALTPHLWRGGRAYPPNGPRQRQMMADGEIDLAISFDPGEASAAIAAAELPPTVRTFSPEGGSIGNASFVAIPYNATAKAGAMVLADFLLSPLAQARKQDPAVWGGFTVLALDRLDDADRALFDALDLGPATLSPEALGPPLPEPHPAWMERIAADWTGRFGAGR
jgi:putative thiamine transport system substrate-binding protein